MIREAALLPGETLLVESESSRAGGHFESELYTGCATGEGDR